MKVIPSSPSILATAAHAALYASSRLVPAAAAAMACDESIFEATPSAVLGYRTFVDKTDINVGLAGNCTGEGLFQMPRMTWTIEPNPDDSVNTTSVYLSPSNVGTVVTDEFGDFLGIQIDRAAVANAAEVAVLIQAPKDGFRSVNIQTGAPFFVNIVKGFTDLTYIYVGGGSTCNPVRGSYIEAGCPQCKDLYTPEEVRGIGPSIVADLSDVNVEAKFFSDKWTFIRSIDVSSFGGAVYNLSLALPEYEYGENGVPVNFNFGAASSKVEIKGNFDCADEVINNMTNGGQCLFNSYGARGCKDCSNELIIDGFFNGYFNVSADLTYGSSPLNAKISGDGCDRLAPRYDSTMDLLNCSEGNVTVDVEPFPCISADIGTVECGADPLSEGALSWPCFCVVPMPASECKDQPSTGLSLGADWIVYLSLPIVGVFLAL